MNHQSLESLTSPSCSASLDELELMWAAVERLATPQRLKTSLSRRFGNKQQHSMIDGNDQDKDQDQILTVDVTKLRTPDRQLFVDQLLQQVEVDNLRLLQKQRDRIRRLGLELPAVEVRYKNLSIEAECEAVHAKPALPTLWNTLKNILFDVTRVLGCKQKTSKICILKDISGIIKPSRMTLLLGPPGCGKTTFLQALSGITEKSLKITGEISYNGYKLNEFVPEKTSAYISQHDLHISEMTVRETLDFSARCQGTRARADIMKEVIKREKQIGVIPDPELDIYMKAVSFEGIRKSLQTDYILKILGLETCADTIAGDAMNRGISGGQKKRLTTAEMIIGPRKVLLMDEISNGLDSSTTFQIITCLQQLTSLTESTILVSLLQPAPEIFALFEDIILMSEGKIVYNGPCKNVLEFFEHCGFQCPPRKGIADFLQQVVSKMDQSKYWFNEDEPHSYISVDDFVNKFKEYSVGKELADELSRPIGKSGSHKDALSFSTYSLKSWELFKACMAREWLLMKRNRFLHIFKSSQLVIIAIITMTVFLRTRMKIDAAHSNHFLGSLFYALIRLMCNGFAELSLTSSRLSVFYKQRKFYFYPAWTYSIPSAILRIPFSLLDAFLWTSLTYYVIGYSPEPDRFFCQFLILFLVHQVSISLFRLMAALVNNQSVAIACGFFCVTVIFIFGGFVISKPSLPAWLEWGFWLSPLAYAEIGVSLNEFRASRWQKTLTSNETIGQQVLQRFGLDYANYYFWISVGALIGFLTVFNIGFNIALAYLKPAGRSYTTIARKGLSNLEDDPDGEIREKELLKNSSTVLPFEPIAISFENVKYSVDVPKELNRQGFSQKRLELLQDITGAFRPGILTALMGVSGAGKTTLMDVISGRKIGGLIEGEIIIGGYPKIQSTYARISGYCEQNDIHSPQITIQESVTYSAWLRLPPHIDRKSRSEIINEVLKMIELDVIKDALVGIAGVSGISNEQRKRLTIAVELVANPSIIFLDEPTTGLDARSAATVMRVVKNIVRARRTVVCTIHQPSIDIFEEFDEVMLMKRGGQLIYYGEIGEHSRNLIEYFEGITGVPEFREHYNPATWMLEVTSSSIEAQLGIDFALLYRESQQFQKNKELVRAISSPPSGSKDIQFSSRFPQNGWEQFKACLWKQRLSYWRSPEYNLVRLTFITICSILFGALLWQKGQTINNEQDLFNMVGSIFIFMLFTGIANCSTVQPYITSERIVFYRERFAGMYSSWAYSFAQVAVEIPYTLLQTIVFSAITYPAINFSMSGEKMIWYFYTMFCTYLYFNYFGMMLVSITSSYLLATVLASFSYTMFNLFSGYLIPKREIPKWWVWAYWICPTSWSLEGLVTSQYGDVNKSIEVFGEHKALNAFLKDYYGYHNQDLVLVAILLFIFPLAFALAFAFAIAMLNFQKR